MAIIRLDDRAGGNAHHLKYCRSPFSLIGGILHLFRRGVVDAHTKRVVATDCIAEVRFESTSNQCETHTSIGQAIDPNFRYGEWMHQDARSRIRNRACG